MAYVNSATSRSLPASRLRVASAAPPQPYKLARPLKARPQRTANGSCRGGSLGRALRGPRSLTRLLSLSIADCTYPTISLTLASYKRYHSICINEKSVLYWFSFCYGDRCKKTVGTNMLPIDFGRPRIQKLLTTMCEEVESRYQKSRHKVGSPERQCVTALPIRGEAIAAALKAANRCSNALRIE